MTKKQESFFAKPAKVEIKDVDDRGVSWGQDASDIANEAGLGSYGKDAALGEEVAEQALAALQDMVSLRIELRLLRAAVAALVLSALAQWMLHWGWI